MERWREIFRFGKPGDQRKRYFGRKWKADEHALFERFPEHSTGSTDSTAGKDTRVVQEREFRGLQNAIGTDANAFRKPVRRPSL
jgi:hypothetical protein